MNERENLIRRIKDTLAIYAVRIDLDKGEASRAAENFYCGLLNILKGYHLRNMNLEKPNYPAIDLGDAAEGLGVQVTSTATRQKVQDTLDAMFRNGVEQDYPHLVMLITKEWRDSRKAFRMDGVCRFDPNADIWDTNWLLAQLDGIDAMEKLEEIRDYLTKHLHLVREPAPAFDLPLKTAMRKIDFLGREAELAQISEEFQKDPIVILSGLGGMGKTELAVRYGQKYQESGQGWAYFLHFNGSFGMTLRNNVHRIIPDYCVDGKPDARVEADALAALNRGGKADLLILDNADSVSIPKLRRELSALRMRVLVTTRKDVAGVVEVKPLSRNALYAIFERNEVDATKEEMDALIDEVDSHTLTVDVMARTMRRGRRAATAEKLLAALRERDLSKGFTKVEIDYAGSPEQARINEHLKAVFRVAELPEEARMMMCRATLLPVEGMDAELFLIPFAERGGMWVDNLLGGLLMNAGFMLPNENQGDCLDDLIEGGWLYMEEELLRIHPVIRIVCIEVLKPTNENCGIFLNVLWAQYDNKQYERVKFRQLAEVFTEASLRLEDTEGKWAHQASILWNKLGEYAKALKCQLRILGTCPQMAESDELNFAINCNNTGCFYDGLGDYRQALQYKMQALEIWVRVLGADQPESARGYNNVGYTYVRLGDYKRALEYLVRSLEIWESILCTDPLDLADSYNNTGLAYEGLGDHMLALEYKLKALEIREQILEANHPDLAQSYDNVGGTYGDLGDYRRALEYRLKALKIQEQVLDADHPDLARGYNNIAYTYGNLGEHQKALRYQLKALEIREGILSANHPDLAISYNDVGGTFYELGDREKALEYLLKALEIYKNENAGNRQALAISYNNVGSIYYAMGNCENALKYQWKALEIQEQVQGTDHPDLALSCNNIAYTYAAMDDFRAAMWYAQRAVKIAQNRFPTGHPSVRNYQQLQQNMETLAQFQMLGIKVPNPYKK